MANAITAGVIYAILVFLIGFILGVIRVLLIVPRLGEPAAVLIETPIILAVSWVVCRWCVDWLDVRRRIGARSIMGVLAFVALLTAEFGLGGLAFGRSLVEQFATYGSVTGDIGLTAQIFALFPVVQIWRR